jgi:hypothetical protein
MAVYPTIQIFEWDITEQTSPNGVRNLYGGHPAWVKELGETISKAMQFEDVILDFSDISGVYQSRVQAFTVGMALNNDFTISSLRFWMPSGTALTSCGHIEFASSGQWVYNAHIPSGYGTVMPSSLPASPNIMAQNGMSWSLDSASDYDTSQFVYLALTVPSGMPLGRYGLGSNGHLAFRVTYDWYWKFNASGSQT